MRLEIYNDVYKWLIQISVLKPDLKNHIIKGNGKTEIDEAQSQQFFNGFKLSEVITKVEANYPNLPKDQSQPLKDNNTPTARLFNWNVLTERLRRVSVELDSDIKSLIVGGDLEMIGEVLKDIYEIQKQRGLAGLATQRQSTPDLRKTQQWDQQKKSQDILNNIDSLNSVKQLNSTESLLEFILISLCHNLNLKPKQAAQLLANNNKLLSHICVKGVKTSYGPVVQWLQEIYTNWAKLIQLCQGEENNIQLVLNVIKPNLLSKDEEVVNWALRLYTKVTFELANSDKLFHVYQWAVKENGGFQSFIICHQRQPQLAEALAGVLLQLSRYDIQDLFTLQMRKFFDSVKVSLEFFSSLLPFLTQSSKIKEGFIESGVLQVWIDQALKLADPDPQNTRDHRIAGIVFLITVWSLYPSVLDLNIHQQSAILNILQRSTHDNSQILRICSVMQTFKLIDALASQKVYSASSVYKKLTSILVENFNDYPIREMMLRQFRYILGKFPNIPIDLVVEPLVKQLQSNWQINIADVEFFKIISSHQNLKVNTAIMMLDALVRLYNGNFVFSAAIFPAIQQILQKFIEKPEFQEFVLKMSSISLSIYQSSTKNKKANKVIQSKYLSKRKGTSVYQVDEDSMVNSQKRALIIELIKYIIQLHSYQMNQLIKPLLVSQHLELKNFDKQNNKGIMILLALLGNPENIIEEVVNQNQTYNQQDLSKSEIVSDSELFLDRRIQKLGPAQSKIFQNVGQEQQFEKKQQASNVQQSQQKEKQFLQQTKEHGQVFLTQKDEEDALMYQLLGEPMDESKSKERVRKPKRDDNKTNNKWQCIYEESELSHIDVPPVEILIISFDEEEDLERESINIILKAHFKTLRYLFGRYCISDNQAAKKRLLQQGNDNQMIRISDIFRILRDYEIQDFTSYEEVIQLVQLINLKFPSTQQLEPTMISSPVKPDPSKSGVSILAKSNKLDESVNSLASQGSEKTNLLRLDFQGFTRFISQFAILVFSRPPRDLRKLPSGQILQELFKYFSVVARKKGENSLIFDDPDGTTTVADKETIRKWNSDLQLHPDVEVPETTVMTHLKKAREEEITLTFGMKRNIVSGLKDNFLMCFELVNDLIQSKFKTNIVEPHSKVKMLFKVKPLVSKGLHKDVAIDPLLERQENLKNSILSLQSLNVSKVKSGHGGMNQSLEMSLSPDMNPFYTTKNLLGTSQSTKVVNKFMQLKVVEGQEKLLEKELKDQKWKKHKEVLDSKHKDIKQFKFEQEMKRLQIQKEEIDKKADNYDKFEEKPVKFINERRDKLQVVKAQVHEEIKTKTEVDAKKQKEFQEKKLQENKEFLKTYTKKEIEKIKLKVKANQEVDQEDKIVKDKEIERQKKQAKTSGQMKQHYQKVQTKKLDFNKKFKALYTEPSIQPIFTNLDKSGQRVFNYFLQYSNQTEQANKLLDLNAWTRFSKTFNIHPDIMYEEQSKSVFLATLQSKNNLEVAEGQAINQPTDSVKGINYYEFEYCLLRLAIKGEEFFNKISGIKDKVEVQSIVIAYNQELVQFEKQLQLNRNKDIRINIYLRSIRQQQKSQVYQSVKSESENKDKELSKIDKVKATTVQAMIDYLDIPAEKEAFDARIRQLIKLEHKVHKPRVVQKDIDKIYEEEAMPDIPQDRQEKKDWKEPGTHKIKYRKGMTEEEKKEQDERELKEQEEKQKQKKFPYIKKQAKVKKLKKILEGEEEKKQKEEQKEEAKGPQP